jgi:competence protein ComEC
VVPVMRSLGIRSLDRLIVSHGDNDHAGGLQSVLAAMSVGTLIASEPGAVGSSAYLPCRQGQRWLWDGVVFQVLHPARLQRMANNNSCVVQITAGEHQVLLPGDIEAAAERELALEYADQLRSTILLAPHHGSATSSSYPLIKLVAPQYVVFSAGYGNSFGHPSRQIVNRYRELLPDLPARQRLLSTASSGMISFTLEPGRAVPPPVQFRASHRRYWRRSGIVE